MPLNQCMISSTGNRSDSGKTEKLMLFPVPGPCRVPKATVQFQRGGVCRDHRRTAAEACEGGARPHGAPTFPPLSVIFSGPELPLILPLVCVLPINGGEDDS